MMFPEHFLLESTEEKKKKKTEEEEWERKIIRFYVELPTPSLTHSLVKELLHLILLAPLDPSVQ